MFRTPRRLAALALVAVAVPASVAPASSEAYMKYKLKDCLVSSYSS